MATQTHCRNTVKVRISQHLSPGLDFSGAIIAVMVCQEQTTRQQPYSGLHCKCAQPRSGRSSSVQNKKMKLTCWGSQRKTTCWGSQALCLKIFCGREGPHADLRSSEGACVAVLQTQETTKDGLKIKHLLQTGFSG